MKTVLVTCVLAVGLSTSGQVHDAGKRIIGYKCMMLNITEQQAMDPNFRVDIKSAPSSASPSAGWAGAVVIVRDPALPENGFLQMLKPNGETAWIRADMVKTYRPVADPTAKCVPEELPNGRIGTGPA